MTDASKHWCVLDASAIVVVEYNLLRRNLGTSGEGNAEGGMEGVGVVVVMVLMVS